MKELMYTLGAAVATFAAVTYFAKFVHSVIV